MFASVARAIPKARIPSQARSMILSGPPQNKNSTAEKIFYGVGMSIAFSAFPAWVLFHIREYRGLE